MRVTRIPEPALSLESLAALWDCEPRTLRAWVDRGELEAVKLGRRWRVPVAAANRFFEARRVARR
jgi:excisionase family DNA binding protein